jgi:hypothetical protein
MLDRGQPPFSQFPEKVFSALALGALNICQAQPKPKTNQDEAEEIT